MRREFWVVIALLLLSGFVSASPFSVVFSPVDNEILPNETAYFDLSINNFAPVSQRFQVYSIDPSWVVSVSPLPVTVPKGTTKTFRIAVKPKSGLGFGTLGVAINVKNLESKDVIRKQLLVAIKSPESLGLPFVPNVLFDVSVPEVIDPRAPPKLRVHLRNRNGLDIKGMRLVIKSPHINENMLVDLGPVSEMTKWYSFDISPKTPSGEYNIKGFLIYKNETVNSFEDSYNIIGYSNIKESFTKRSNWFKIVKTAVIRNEGNIAGPVNISMPVSFFSRIFSKTTPKAEYVKGIDGRAFVWHIVVAPGKEKVLVMTENYRWLIGLIILLLIMVIAYFIFRSPVIAVKEIVSINKGEGISEIKIRVFIKNRSNKMIQGVEVLDKVPSIAELKSTHVLGTVKPTKVTKVKSGTIIRWNLDVLEPYEERILTYTIKSKLKIVGKVSLPQSQVKFETGRGQERIIYSNNILIME